MYSVFSKGDHEDLLVNLNPCLPRLGNVDLTPISPISQWDLKIEMNNIMMTTPKTTSHHRVLFISFRLFLVKK